MAGIRCEECRKFTGNDVEVELDDPEVDGDEITFDAAVTVNCTECGGQKVGGTAEYRETIDHSCDDEEKDDLNLTDGYDLDVTANVDHTYKNKNGAGAMMTMTITCNRCGADIAPPALHIETDDLS